MQMCACKRDTVQTDTQTTHIVLIFRETLYTRRVTDMLHDRIVQACFQCFGAVVEVGCLVTGEIIELRFVAAREMRKDALHAHRFLPLQAGNEFGYLLAVETQTVHARIDFDVYRVVFQPFGGCGFDDVR